MPDHTIMASEVPVLLINNAKDIREVRRKIIARYNSQVTNPEAPVLKDPPNCAHAPRHTESYTDDATTANAARIAAITTFLADATALATTKHDENAIHENDNMHINATTMARKPPAIDWRKEVRRADSPVSMWTPHTKRQIEMFNFATDIDSMCEGVRHILASDPNNPDHATYYDYAQVKKLLAARLGCLFEPFTGELCPQDIETLKCRVYQREHMSSGLIMRGRLDGICCVDPFDGMVPHVVLETKRRTRDPVWLTSAHTDPCEADMHVIDVNTLTQLDCYMFISCLPRAILIEVYPSGHVMTPVCWSGSRWFHIKNALDLTGTYVHTLTQV